MELSFDWSTILHDLRKDNGLTQGEVAEILHTSRQNSDAIEQGRVTPKAIMIAVLSDIYNIDLFEYALNNLPQDYVAEKQIFKTTVSAKHRRKIEKMLNYRNKSSSPNSKNQ